MKAQRGRKSTLVAAKVGVLLRAVLLTGVCVGVISAESGTMSFRDLLSHLEKESYRVGSGNRDASVDYLRYSGNVRVSCRRRGLCNCYSRAIRRSFCCDCMMGPCFPADAKVTTPKGQVTMGDLTTGDVVLAGTESGEVVWSPVVAWLDRRPNEEAQYISITTEGGPTLTLSSSHLLFTSKEEQILTKFAGAVSADDSLLMIKNTPLLSKDSKSGRHLESPNFNGGKFVTSTNITNMTAVIKTGAYVPLTETGTIFVNGFLASCYASVTHDIAHVFLAPVRWFPSWITGGDYEGTMPFVVGLKWIAARFLPYQYLAPKDTSVVIHRWDQPRSLNPGLSTPCFGGIFSHLFHEFVVSV